MSDPAVPTWQGDGTLWNSPVLVVEQKAKLIELNNEYGVFDASGTPVATVRQTGQSALKKIVRFVSSFDQFMTHHLEVLDPAGQVTMRLTRPAAFLKSKVVVADATGNELGRIVQQNVWGKRRFTLEANGHTYGMINAENWRAWDFAITDHTGAEIARIKKTWEGLAKAAFTTADNYVVAVHQPLQDPLRVLVAASALAIDTAIKQAGGFN